MVRAAVVVAPIGPSMSEEFPPWEMLMNITGGGATGGEDEGSGRTTQTPTAPTEEREQGTTVTGPSACELAEHAATRAFKDLLGELFFFRARFATIT